MKRLLFFLTLFFLPGLTFAQTQAVRFGDGEPVLTTQTVQGFSAAFLVAVSNATINFCGPTANGVPCTNLATTFTTAAASVQCPTNQQVVLEGSTSCVSTTDTRGSWGVWALPGQYSYTVTYGGASFGPFYATLGGSSTGGGIVIPGAANDLLASGGPIANSFVVDTGKIFFDPVTHFLHAFGYQSDSPLPFLIHGLPNPSACTAGPLTEIQFAYCQGLATLSYLGDGPFAIQRYGKIGQTLLQNPASTYIPLNADNCLPLGAQGDAGWLRVNPGVLNLADCAALSQPARLNVAGSAGFGSNGNSLFMAYSQAAGANQIGSDISGTGPLQPWQWCVGGSGNNCKGIGLSLLGTLFPLSGNPNPDLGSPSVGQFRNIFMQGALVESGQYTVAYTNDSTGTQIGMLAKRSSVTDGNGNLEATIATTADTVGLYGVVVGESAGGTCGVGSNCTTGVAYVAYKGHTTAAFDGSVTLKHWAVASTVTAANLADSGIPCTSQPPRNVDFIGCIQSTNTGAGTYAIDLNFQPADSGGIFNCGATVACANTLTTTAKTVYGRVSLSSGTPSTAVLTGLPFTSSSTYQVIVTNATTAANGLKITYSSGSSATITGPNTVTDSVSYIAIGN